MRRPDDALAPLFIGLAVTLIISVVSPLSQAGINPARDLGPRLFAALAGLGLAAALVFTRILQPLMNQKGDCDGCGCSKKDR